MGRETELYKDKIEVSLDGRQIFYLFFGGAVIVGLVFVLGVMVGRRVEARGHTDHATAAATVGLLLPVLFVLWPLILLPPKRPLLSAAASSRP